MSDDISPDDKNLALLAHLLGIVFGFIPPLVIWLLNKDKPDKAFVIDQAKEALNFQITVSIAAVVCGVLAFVIGLVLLSILLIADIVFCIIATIAVSNGTAYRYPVALRLIA
ncbi:MAG: DUF4870 domain-containing protein [Azoarcus sp.]|jgi:uncharacterized Tic20 family protein|nr:DUF4870 domain-containing protein [Azoarcus sp.]